MRASTKPHTAEQAGPCVAPKDPCHVFPVTKCLTLEHVTSSRVCDPHQGSQNLWVQHPGDPTSCGQLPHFLPILIPDVKGNGSHRNSAGTCVSPRPQLW